MMELPLFKYPTTIVWIDDDKLFLKAITRIFSKHFTIKTFDQAEEGINFLENYSPSANQKKFLRGCIESENYDASSHMPVDVSTMNLYSLFLNTERYQEISVMVIDYQMPNINGIDICRALKRMPMKKILLTGKADDQNAISAFNEGIIDRFVRKDISYLSDILKDYLNELVDKYFYENTRILLSHLEADQPSPISDVCFVEWFNNMCKTMCIKEYYLADKNGSFRLVDENNNISYFILHTEKTLDSFVDVYRDTKPAYDLIEKIKKRELVPFFGIDREAWQVNETDWSPYMYKPFILNGENQRYYLTKAS